MEFPIKYIWIKTTNGCESPRIPWVQISVSSQQRIPGRVYMNCIGSDEQHRVGTIITTQVVCLAIYIQFAIFIRVCVMGKVQFNVHKHNALDATFARYILDCGLGFYLPYFSTFHAWWRSDILNCSIMLHNVCDWIAYVANNACVVLAFVACCSYVRIQHVTVCLRHNRNYSRGLQPLSSPSMLITVK